LPHEQRVGGSLPGANTLLRMFAQGNLWNDVMRDVRAAIGDPPVTRGGPAGPSRGMSRLRPLHSPIDRRGFTLLELLVVVAIIGILAVFTLFNVQHALRKAREGRTYAHLHTLRTATDMFNALHDSWPNQISDGGVPGWGDQYVVGPLDELLPAIPITEVATLPDALGGTAYVAGVWNDHDAPAWQLGNTQGFYYCRNSGASLINNGNLSTEGKRYQDY
jgi:prepilin-type N-terminal cleavage/methylation domain-containing protein